MHTDSQPKVSPMPFRESPRRHRLPAQRRLPAIVALAAACALIAGCSGPTPSPTSAAVTSSSPSMEIVPVPSLTPSSSAFAEEAVTVLYPCTSREPGASRPTDEQLSMYRDVIQTGNTEPASTHACDPLTLLLMATECCAPKPANEALADWGRRIYDPSMSWEFNIDPGLLASWRTGPYAQFVVDGALIATNPDGRITSILFDGDLISLLFVGGQELMLG